MVLLYVILFKETKFALPDYFCLLPIVQIITAMTAIHKERMYSTAQWGKNLNLGLLAFLCKNVYKVNCYKS